MDRYPRGRLWLFAALTILTLGLDLGSKAVAFSKLGVFQRTGWLIDTAGIRFEFQTSLNRGALWGLGQGYALWFAGLSVLAFVGIVYWLFVRGAAQSAWLTVALGFVSGGTLGNLYDRVGMHGVAFPGEGRTALAVRDFLHFQFGSFDWANFNLADSFLVTGAIMLMIHSFREDSQRANSTVAESSTESSSAASA
ncbi:MAG: signal peptidase II [Planctomycetaceae bacterium]